MNNYQDIKNESIQNTRNDFAKEIKEKAKIDTEYPARTVNIMLGIFHAYKMHNKSRRVPLSYFKEQFLALESDIHVSPDVDNLKKDVERTMDKLYKAKYITYLDWTEEPVVSPQKCLEEMLDVLDELI